MMKSNRRAVQRYYDDLERRMAPEDRQELERRLNRGLALAFLMPLVGLAGAATGYLIGGQEWAFLVWGTTVFGFVLDLMFASHRWQRSVREYHEDRGGRAPRPWVRKEIQAGSMVMVPEPKLVVKVQSNGKA